jgi:predicted molibdopterin-dependent oxidoreductase YjgC
VALLNELAKLQTPKSKIQNLNIEGMTGVPRETLRQAAEMLAQAERGFILYGPALARSANGEAILAALTNLALLTNSSGPYYLAEDCNSLGALDMGVAPHLLLGRQSITDGEALQRFSRRWSVELSSEAGLSVDEMLEAAIEGKLRALYVMESDPATLCPGGKRALEELDFLVVQDLFLTQTAQLADVVLPAASFAEVDGTFTNLTGRVQRLRGALRPPGQARPDDQILVELAKAMGCGFGYASTAEVMAEVAKLASMDREQRTRDKGQGDLSFKSLEYQPPAGNNEYPLALVTGRLLYDGGTRLGQSEIMRQLVPEPFVEINPADAEALGIADGATVTVASSRGELKLIAKVSDDIRPGCVFVPRNFPEAPVSTLLDKAAIVTWVSVKPNH